MTKGTSVLDKNKMTIRDFIYLLMIIIGSLTSGLSSYYVAKADREDLREETTENAGDIKEINGTLQNYNLGTMMYILNSIDKKVDELQKDIDELQKQNN